MKRRLVVVARENNTDFETTVGFENRLTSVLKRIGISYQIDFERMHDVRYEYKFREEKGIYKQEIEQKIDFAPIEVQKEFLKKTEELFYTTEYQAYNNPLKKRLYRYFMIDVEKRFHSILLFIVLRVFKFFGFLIEDVWFDGLVYVEDIPKEDIPNGTTRSLMMAPPPTVCTDPWNFDSMQLPLPPTTPASSAGGGTSTSPLGLGIRVAVLDGGVRITHPNIVSKLIDVSGRKGVNCLDPNQPNDLTPRINHGTEVAGIISSNLEAQYSVAPQSTILNMRVIDTMTVVSSNEERRYASYVGRGLQICAQPAISGTGTKAKVINISLNFTSRNFRFAAADQIQNAFNEKCIIVMSAGNNGLDASGYVPSTAIGKCIIVAGVGQNGLLKSTSNRGSAVTVAAPADNVCTLASFSDSIISNFNGTSAAAPHVAGLIANMLSMKPNLSFTQIRDALVDYGDAIPSHGFKKINATNTLNNLPA